MHRSIGFVSLALVLLVGCASSTESGSEESAKTHTTSGLELIDFSPLAATDPASETSECEPGDTRACQKTYLDEQGASHSTTATQYCANDGSAWLECGEVPSTK